MGAAFNVRKVVSIRIINEITRWVTFDAPTEAKPGQFVMVWLPDVGEKPFSIVSMDPLGLLVVDVGPFSHAMHQLTVGDPVWIKGPLGQGFSIEGERILLVGGGYGAAPLYPLAIEARGHGVEVHTCLGAHSEPGLLLSDEFTELGCQVSLSTEDGSRGRKSLVTRIVEDAILQSQYDTLYACGPSGMLFALADICKEHRINYQCSWEAHMRCGMGLCGSCEVPTTSDPSLPSGWLACFDGPVFIKRWVS